MQLRFLIILATLSAISCEVTSPSGPTTNPQTDMHLMEDIIDMYVPGDMLFDRVMTRDLAGPSVEEVEEVAGMSAGASAGVSTGEEGGEPESGSESHSGVESQELISDRQYTQNFEFTYDRSVTSGNPLKGFLTSYLWAIPNNDLPHSLEFNYFPLADITSMPDTYDFETSIEPQLQAVSRRNHHMILRVYLDYPSRESALPIYLRDLISCSPYSEYGGGCSPDYQNPHLQRVILDFIRAFGARYDGDQRIAFIQIGLLGFWGEWHTYPHINWFADDTFQQSVITSFDEAFEITPIQLRIPVQDSPRREIGFHDDSFVRSTIGDVDWFFWPKILASQAERRWEVAPMGGEVYPEYQRILFTDAYPIDIDHQDPLTAIQVTHMSYLLNYQAFNMDGMGYTGEQRLQAEQASNAMGYEFTLEQASVEVSRLRANQVDLRVSIALRNSGVAPFYYPLSLVLKSVETGEAWVTELEVSALLPAEESLEFTFHADRVSAVTLTQGFTLQLTSAHLLEGQVIRWANQEQSEGVLSIPSRFNCSFESSMINLGSSLDFPQGRCFCDVDGLFYTLDGMSCSR